MPRCWSGLPDPHGGDRGSFILGGSCCRNPAPEGAAGSHPALVGGASCNPPPKGVTGDDPAQVGGVSYNPAPEGVQVSLLLTPPWTSMLGRLHHDPMGRW